MATGILATVALILSGFCCRATLLMKPISFLLLSPALTEMMFGDLRGITPEERER